MDSYKSTIEKYKDHFKNHEITEVINNEQISRHIFKDPDTGTYAFTVTCADNLIIMNGDCYSLYIEPGYGRHGLSFLKSSIESYDYFIGKCPYIENTTEFDQDYAKQLLTEHLKEFADCDEKPYSKNDIEDLYLEDDSIHGEVAYYEFCYKHEIYEPFKPRRYKHKTLNQIAGLQVFIKKLEETGHE